MRTLVLFCGVLVAVCVITGCMRRDAPRSKAKPNASQSASAHTASTAPGMVTATTGRPATGGSRLAQSTGAGPENASSAAPAGSVPTSRHPTASPALQPISPAAPDPEDVETIFVVPVKPTPPVANPPPKFALPEPPPTGTNAPTPFVLPPPPPVHRRETFRLKLASGREIDVGVAMTAAKSLIETRLSEVVRGDNVLRANHANGRPQVLVCRVGPILRGPTASFREDGRPMTYVTYDRESQREGAVLTWADNGRPVVFEQYEEGRLHGLRCLVKPCSEECPEGHLWLVEEWSRGKLQESHVVDAQGAVHSYDAVVSAPTSSRPQELREATQELDAFERQFDAAEQQLRTAVGQIDKYQKQLIAQAKLAAMIQQRQALVAQIESALSAQASALAAMRASTVRACGSG